MVILSNCLKKLNLEMDRNRMMIVDENILRAKPSTRNVALVVSKLVDFSGGDPGVFRSWWYPHFFSLDGLFHGKSVVNVVKTMS